MAKRRAAGEGMLRRRGKGWEVRLVIGHNDDGTPIFRHLSAKTQKEALEKLHNAQEIYRDIELTADSRITFGEWLDKWMNNYMSTSVRESTLRGYRGYIERHIRPHLGDKRIDKLTTNDIQNFYNVLKTVGRCVEHAEKGSGLAGATVRRIHGVVRQSLEAAVQARMIPYNPCDGVTLPKLDSQPMQVLNASELAIFKAAIKGVPEWYDFFYTEITTGMRLGEICGLMWSDFDEAKGTLYIQRTLHLMEKGRLVVGETKTGKGMRKILLPPGTAEILRERKKRSFSQWIFWNPLRPEAPISPNGAYLTLKRILREAELPNIRFHDLRHTFATHALSSGVDPKTLSEYIGHTNASFTLDTYAHVTSEMSRGAAEITQKMMTRILGRELKPWAKTKDVDTAPEA